MAINLKPINRQFISLTIRGVSPLIQHNWDHKSLEQIRDKKLGKKTKNREILDAEREFQEACYMTAKDEYGVPLLAIKSAMISAAHKDIGIEKTLVRKAFFIPCDDPKKILPMRCDDPIMREDYVRVGTNGTDLRYRPEFSEWAVDVRCEFDADLLRPEDIVNLINRAGFGVGIGEWRPEKGGEYGRFEVDQTVPVNLEGDK